MWSRPLDMTPTTLSPIRSTQHFRLRSPLCLSHPRGTPPPPAPSSLAPSGGSSVFICLLLAAATVVSVTSIAPLNAPALPLFAPLPSLVLPTATLTPPLLFLGLLCLPAPPRAPPPLALAADISRKDKYISDRTGRGEARCPTVGRSAPHRMCPISLLYVVGYGIRHPLLLQRPQ